MALELLSEFPYFKVGNHIFDNNYYGRVADYKSDWPNNKITQIWYYYEKGLEDEAIKPVDIRSDLSSVYYLEAATPYKRAHIIYWLTAVQDLARQGVIDAGFYTGKRIASNPVQRVIYKIKETAAEITQTGKLGIGLAAGALVLYLAWPVIAKTAVKRTRKRITA
jgi:hypothetical protein